MGRRWTFVFRREPRTVTCCGCAAKAAPGIGGASGDALIEITVAPDHQFHREGDDIIVRSSGDAAGGGYWVPSLEVPTIRGPVRLAIPAGSGTGTRLRLRGRGVRDGHQFVQLQVVVPPGDEPELLAEFLKSWTPQKPFNPRETS